MIASTVLVSVTATTRDDDEFKRIIDWCYDVAKLRSVIAAGSENGIHVIRVTLPETDPRLDDFECHLEGQSGWSVERWP